MYFKKVLLGICGLLFLSCSKSYGLTGIYKCDGILGFSYEFKKSGEGYRTIKSFGHFEKKKITYKIDNDKVTINSGDHSYAYTLKQGKLLSGDSRIGSCSK